MAHGLDATGLDIAPTAIAEAQALYPQLKERFIVGDLFNPAPELRGAFDVVLEHTCMSGLPPALRGRAEGVRPCCMLSGTAQGQADGVRPCGV